MHGLVIRVKRSAGRGIAGYYRKAEGLTSYDEIVIAKPYLFHDPDKTGPQGSGARQPCDLPSRSRHLLLPRR